MNKKEIQEAIAAEKARHEAVMKDLQSKFRVIQMEEESHNRAAYEERKKLLNATGDWLKKNNILKIGDLIQVTGSKAGKYRSIVGITPYCVIGRVASQKRERQMDGSVKLVWAADVSKVTEQGLNKITHIFRNGKFVHVKDLMEQANEMV